MPQQPKRQRQRSSSAQVTGWHLSPENCLKSGSDKPTQSSPSVFLLRHVCTDPSLTGGDNEAWTHPAFVSVAVENHECKIYLGKQKSEWKVDRTLSPDGMF